MGQDVSASLPFYFTRKRVLMPQFYFSPAVYAGVRKFFAEHPTVEITMLREANMAGPCVRLGTAVCGKCGTRVELGKLFKDTLSQGLSALGEEMPSGALPADFLQAVRITHAWDQASRSVYCGGEMAFESRPALRLAVPQGA